MKISFSTEVVDLHYQAPNRNRRESKYYWDELYTLFSAAGFTQMEIPYEPKWDFGGRSGIPLTMRSVLVKFQTVENYKRFLKEKGMEGISSIHLDPTLFCSGNMMMYFGGLKHYTEEAIQFARDAGAETVVLSATPTYYAVSSLRKEGQTFEELEREFLAETAGIIDELALTAQKAGVKLCLKNEYWTLLRGEKIVSFLKTLKHPVFLDVDTANLQIAGTDIPAFIRRNKEYIGIVHFTDTAFTDDQEAYRQVMPEYPAKAATKVFRDIGDGQVDLKAVYQTLKDTGYDGQVVFNCRHSYDVSRALLRTRYFINQTLGK